MSATDLEVLSRFSAAGVGLLAAVIAAVAGWVGLQQFRLARAENRYKRFFELKSAFRSQPHMQEVLNRLYQGPPGDDLPLSQRIEFMGFFEDVALLEKTGQMPTELAFYMFGGDAIAAWGQSWLRNITDNAYWTLLEQFVGRMKALESNYIGSDRRMHADLFKTFRV